MRVPRPILGAWLVVFFAGAVQGDGPAADSDAALMQAVSSGDVGAVKRLLEAGADPNGRGEEQPLFDAVFLCEGEIVRLLLAAGADAKAVNTRGQDIFGVSRYPCWLKMVMGRETSQAERGEALVLAGIDRYLGVMVERKRQEPHWGQGLIGYWRGQAYFWSEGFGSKPEMARVARAAEEVLPLLSRHGAGRDPASPIWASNARTDNDRLHEKFGKDSPIRAAVWQDGDRQKLVCFFSGFAPLWRFHCFVFDSSLNLVTVGEGMQPVDRRYVMGGGGETLCEPYALVEYRSRSTKMPENMRERWMLAVACRSSEQQRDPGRAVELSTRLDLDSHGSLVPGETALVLPIDLYGHEVDLRALEYGLWDLDDLELRFAEAGHPFSAAVLRPRNPESGGRKPVKSSTPAARGSPSRDTSLAETNPATQPPKSGILDEVAARDVRLRLAEHAHLFWIILPDGVYSLAGFFAGHDSPQPPSPSGLFSRSMWSAPRLDGRRFSKGVTWKREDGDLTIVADVLRGFAAGTAGVFAFDRKSRLVALGEYQTNDDSPESLALVEFRSSDARLPKAMRGKWMLALAQASYWQKLDKTKPVVFGVWPRPLPDTRPEGRGDLSDGNRLRIHPVDWYNDGIDFRAIDVPLSELSGLEIRVAEPDPFFKR